MNSMGFQNIQWTAAKRDALRMAYREAVDKEALTFGFDGHYMLTDYAKYLLEFLDQRFGGVTEQGEH